MDSNKLKQCAYNEKLVRLKDVNDALTAQFIDSPLDSDRWVIGRIQFRVNDISAVDAVEVVRCEDCRYCEGKFIKSNGETILRCWLWDKNLYSNGYCAWGERREDGDA
jgi:hypothetical protein